MTERHRWRRIVPLALLSLAAACDRQVTEPAATAPAAPTGGYVAPLLAPAAGAIPGRYLVVLNDGAGSVQATSRELVGAEGGRMHHTYEHTLQGFAATLTPQAVERLRRNPRVRYVAQDGWVSPSQTTQPNATWGLDRIDQRALPLNTSYTYAATGSGVRVYVIDSGIRTTHSQFGGRASVGTDFIADGRNGQDCNGHGTHVAGTIAGSTYGVAKAARVIAVRVFACTGSTPTSTIIAAVDWVTANAQKPAVANMSLGGSYYQPLNDAVQASIASGVVYVVAAGNDNINACQASPASTPAAITVGATTSADVRSSFSNWGTCVDIFAPGSSITSAWWESDTQIHTINGTSMAAPHVAGVAALALQAAPTATPAVIAEKIRTTGTFNRLTGLGTGSPNNLVFSRLTVEPPAPIITLNPGSLAFTFVRSVAGAAAPAALSGSAPRPVMAASGGGAPKVQAAGAAAVYEVATTASTLSSRVVLGNPGTGALEWTATSSQPWLAVDPKEGSVSSTYSGILTATATPGSLAAGTHSATVTVAGTGATPRQLPVTLRVADARVLAPGTPRTGLAGTAGSQAFYEVTVPASATSLTIAMSGGTGDADLHVRYGQLPTTTQYDCRPFTTGNTESCHVSFPAPGTYYVMLNAFSAYGGVTLSATLGGLPGAPSNLRATSVAASSIALAWTDGSTNESSFTLQRASMSGAGTWSAFQNVAAPGAGATSFTSTGLVTGTQYRFRVRACNAAGCSAWASSATMATPGVAPPTGATSTAVSGTAVRLSWTDASTNETSFTVGRALRNADGTWAPWVDVASAAANATSFTNSTGLAVGATYQFRVRACNGATCSAWVGAGTVTLPKPPAAPTGATTAILSPTSVRLAWNDASANETSFTVGRALRNADGTWGAWADVATTAANATQYSHTGLLAGRTYQFRVRACNLAGCSLWVTPASVTLPAAAPPPAGM